MSDLSYLGGPSLSDLFPSIASHLEVPGETQDRIGLPSRTSYVVALVDGLGWDIVMRSLAEIEYIPQVMGDARKITAGMPTTTSTSLMSLWMGTPPGSHGVVGFSFRPRVSFGGDRLVKPLFLRDPLDMPRSILDRSVDAGVSVAAILAPGHVDSGFTRMGMRKIHAVGIDEDDAQERIRAVVRASSARSVVYLYDSRLDHAGHAHGVDSQQWRSTLRIIDSFLGRLKDALPDDCCLVVTGDHGMVDVSPQDRVLIEEEPELNADIVLIGGEARFRHVYTHAPQAVAHRWKSRVGEHAWVLTREQALDEGIFGQVRDEFLCRLGDVMVVSRGRQSYLSQKFLGEFHLVGMHGAGTSAERNVPVIVD